MSAGQAEGPVVRSEEEKRALPMEAGGLEKSALAGRAVLPEYPDEHPFRWFDAATKTQGAVMSIAFFNTNMCS